MMDTVEVSGRTVDEAVDRALDQLGLSRDQVDVDVVSEGRAGFLGIGAEEAVVRVTSRSSPDPDGSGETTGRPSRRRGRRRGERTWSAGMAVVAATIAAAAAVGAARTARADRAGLAGRRSIASRKSPGSLRSCRIR